MGKAPGNESLECRIDQVLLGDKPSVAVVEPRTPRSRRTSKATILARLPLRLKGTISSSREAEKEDQLFIHRHHEVVFGQCAEVCDALAVLGHGSDHHVHVSHGWHALRQEVSHRMDARHFGRLLRKRFRATVVGVVEGGLVVLSFVLDRDAGVPRQLWDDPVSVRPAHPYPEAEDDPEAPAQERARDGRLLDRYGVLGGEAWLERWCGFCVYVLFI